MLQITPSLFLDKKELTYDFILATGPGGQNINKVASGVQLRLDVTNSTSLPLDIKERLVKIAGSRITRAGVLVIEAKRFRTQEQNRLDAEKRLVTLIQKAFIKPKERHPTRPSAAARARRIETKKRRGTIKRNRQAPSIYDEK